VAPVHNDSGLPVRKEVTFGGPSLSGTKQYLQAEVLPHVRPALAALLHKMQEERLQVCCGFDQKAILKHAADCIRFPDPIHKRILRQVLPCLQLAAGAGLDGQFRPQPWRPFCPQEWLAAYLLDHKATVDAAGAVPSRPAAERELPAERLSGE